MRRPILGFPRRTLLLLLSGLAPLQPRGEAADVAHSAAAPAPVVHTQEVYKTVGGTVLKVDVFRPDQRPARPDRTAIVFFHGGGWAFGSPAEFFAACEHYAARGAVTFSVEYRLSIQNGVTPHPAISPIEAVMDARSAMRWVRAQSARFSVAPNRLVAAGQSAGGHLALSTAMIDDCDEPTDDRSVSCRPDAVVLFSACVNAVEGWCDRLLGERRTRIWSISPAHHVRPGLPPMIEFHGTVDDQVPVWTVQFFAEEMKKAGNRFELHQYEGRRHYLGAADARYAGYFDDEILRLTDDFLRQNRLMD